MNSSDADSGAAEIYERQSAELEFVSAAYSTDEAWILQSSRNTSIHRRFDLSILNINQRQQTSNNDASSSNTIPLELVLSMPLKYPIDPGSVLQVDAFLPSSSSHSTKMRHDDQPSPLPTSTSSSSRDAIVHARKLALNAIPNLLQVCRESAEEQAEAGEEAVFVVLTRASQWVDDCWLAIRKKDTTTFSSSRSSSTASCLDDSNSCTTTTLGRRLIYSHHIIAKSKRKAIADLTNEYTLGGYAKIGWPGIILIEGAEDDCIAFVAELRSMRWQYLVVRGEEQETVSVLDDARKFPRKFEELGEDQMSYLAGVCREVGLERLFLTSMKIYKPSDDDDVGDDVLPPPPVDGPSFDLVYGVLIHVDHMNDERSYRKWIQKACKTNGCSVILKRCYPNDAPTNKAIIIVGLWGDEGAVKQVLKRWRTSRVDVDSKGKPCLERMMSVLAEGVLEQIGDNSQNDVADSDDVFDSELKSVSLLIRLIGGDLWEDALSALLR